MNAFSAVAGLALLTAAFALTPGAVAEAPLPTDIPYCLTTDCRSPTSDLCAGGVQHPAPGMTVYTSSDCSQRVDIKTYDCVWNCGWHTYVQGPPVTVRVYEQNDGEVNSASAIEIPNPCGPTALCTGPECGADVGTGTLFGLAGRFVELGMVYVGPHAGARVASDCGGVDVWETGLDCQPHLLPLAHDEAHQAAGPVQADADTCQLGFICACLLASAVEPPNPCGPTALCQGPECPAAGVSTSDLLAYLGPHASAGLSRDCQASASESGLQCAIGTDRVQRTIGPVSVGADVCWPDLMCTCDPVLVSSAAALPGISPPPQCLTTGCCFAPCPPPCYDSCQPSGPCPQRVVGTPDYLPVLGFPVGPHATVRTSSDCSVSVTESGTPCSSLADVNPNTQVAGPATVNYESCRLNPDCTCDPLPIELTSAASAQPPPCYTYVGGCCGTFAPCPSPVACKQTSVGTSDFLAYLGPHARATLEGDCDVALSESGRICPSGWEEYREERSAGKVHVGADACRMILYCTCDPMPIELASAVAAEPPVQVEFVQCVTAPCPPRVTCTPSTSHIPGFQVDRSRSCHVTLTQDPLPCEGIRYESTTVGLVTVRRAYCGPGIEP